MQTKRTRFLPKALTVELRRLPWRVLGASLVGIAAACWLSLVSWSYGDPSPNFATTAPPHNWLGLRGASVADGLMHAFGLASPFLILPLAALGFRVASGHLPLRPRLRAAYWTGAALFVPAFFAMFPAPSRWVLDTGLGGIAGDIVAARVGKLAQAVPAQALWPAFAILFLPVGVWCVFRACGFSAKALTLAFRAAAPATLETRAAAPSPDAVAEEGDGRLVNKATSWVKRFALRDKALTVTPPPREFWMIQARTEPRFTPAKVEKPKSQGVAPMTEPRGAAVSPFADWGSRPAPAAFVPPTAASPAPAAFEARAGREQERAREREREPEPEPEREREEAIFEDIRIEPFFGPLRGTPPSNGAKSPEDPEPQPGTSSPFRRLTGKAIESARNGAQRMLENGASIKRRKPLIYVKGGAVDLEAPEEEEPEPENLSSALPPLSLLAPPPHASGRPDAHDPVLMQRAAALMGVLGDFGVKGRISGIYPGPVITLYELEPARGTKSSRVVGLADDIARSMSAVSARVAVVPGRDAIGIELPNPKREIVSLRGMLESQAFQDSQAALPLALGKSIGGEPIVVDLARMPHLLIAGTTGSGKSVGINTMILSLLYRLPPSQCNFIMIDPKMLELSVYDNIPHLLAPVVTDPKKAVAALKWTVKEMNTRYELMSKLGVRNITSYNAKAAAAQLRGQPLRRMVQTGFDPRTGEPIEEEETFEPVAMTYIVVVIDEMADLMMVAGKDIEYAVQRLSQMARAAGIHLIMATQRPSVDVVTGTIKANFPSRISFQVTSKIDSRTIIGEQGAEQLLGQGDMLYMAAGGRIIRAHGPFVSDEEVETVARHLKAQGFPNYRDDILEDAADFEDGPTRGNGAGNGEGGRDLYREAVDIVLKDRKPTTSYLQRRLGIGYNRAATLIERMEQEGVVGAPSRTGRREILLDQ
jgi:DNA segregation ATPase FtsK/SpoIIIE, S-DNA-T family